VGSTRAEGRRIGAVPRVDADLVKAAAALRWARPDLAAELADHVLEEASFAGQEDRWLVAAGWAVHARAATGDGRDTSRGVLAALGRWGSDALSGAAADRLRIELAMVAAGAGEVEFARRLLGGVHADGSDPELAADLLCAHARCAVEDAPDEVANALDAADAAWATVGGPAAQLGGASVALVRAVVERRAGRPEAAVDHAADGLGRLERGRTGSGSPSGHLAAALAAEWISALLDAGRVTEARDGCGALLPRLSEQTRPTRQLALLRLTVTRVLAAQDARADTSQDAREDTAQLLAQAAEDAAGSDVPDLEAVCCTALGALHEQAGRLDVALEALQVAVGAERRDRDRSRRFLAALAELPAEPGRPQRRRERAGVSAGTGEARSTATTSTATTSTDATTVLPAITRGDRKLRANRGEDQERAKSRFERLLEEPSPVEAEADSPAAEERSTAWGAVPWSGSAGDSPIGDLLIRSWRDGSAQPADDKHSDDKPADDKYSANGSGRRNGKSIGVPEHRSVEPDVSSGWVPTLDADRAGEEQAPLRRRGRFSDTDRRRSRRARDERSREERDDTTSVPPRHVEPVRYADDDSLMSGGGAEDTDSSGEQERSAGRSRRRSRHGDGERAGGAADRAARGRRGGSEDTDDSERGESRRSRGTRSGDGARRRTEEPSATDPWSPGAGSYGSNSNGSNSNGEADPVAAGAVSSGTSDDSDGWLQSALAELDRALSGIGVGGPARIEEPPPDDGCAVVVDIARDGRRFAGPRAAAVVRSVADLLADRLPPGARSRFGDSDVLVVTGAGWSRADATEWMHRTLPGLLDGFVAAEELPGAQLRVAVHDADGPVGAQILQPLTTDRDRATAEDRRGAADRDPWADITASTSEVRGQKYRAAARADRQERGPRGRRELDAEAMEPDAGDGGSPRWPFSGEAERSDPAPLGDTGSPGRHGADRASSALPARDEAGDRGRRHRADAQDRASGERDSAKPSGSGRAGRRRSGEAPSSTGSSGNGSAGNGSAGNGSAGNGSIGNGSIGNGSIGNGVGNGAGPEPGGSGRRAKRDGGASTTGATTATEQATASESREPARAESTEGLGIADLLAGALAAYRGI
jgi:hypothetical protein